ncbi:hypothetical protein [Mycoplasma ovis]|uniref:hypothetical protein n=1 Tax=Mycoplasma ovis TaxID=171632 RepID=UPI00041AB28C|nr:hypothetical protein [Mycoplasma ovis]
MCGKKVNNELKTSFFQFDNSVLKTNRAAKVEANHIVSITYSSSTSINMKFEKGPRSVKLKNPPWGEVNPDNDCSLDKAGGSTDTLKCGDTSGSEVEVQRGINI